MEPRYKIRAESSYPATSLLLVSVEARTVATKAYPLAFQAFLLKPLHFNFENDTLYFRGLSALEYFIKMDFASSSDENPTGADMKKIRHVVYPGSIVARFEGSSEPYPVLSEKGLGRFTGLRTLKIPIPFPI